MDLIGAHDDKNPRIHIRLGRRTLVLNHRYELVSILNDIFIGIFFAVGSVLFYFSELQNWAITMFVLGSIDFLLRPVIRLARRLNVVYPGDEPQGDDSYEY